MSIESGQDNKTASQQQSIKMAYKTAQSAMGQQTQYSNMLLGDIGMIGGNVDTWPRPSRPHQQFIPSPLQQQQYDFTSSPAVLTRYTSMPVRQMTPRRYHQQTQQQPATSFAIGTPLTLARHHSHGYVSTMQQQQEYISTMSMTMPLRQVHVNEMQHLLEISMDRQQPLQYQIPAEHCMMKSETTTSSDMKVEPIAFTGNNSKMTIDNLHSLTYTVFGNTPAFKPVLPEMPQDFQHIDDSLDHFLPEIEQVMFRSPELDQITSATSFAHAKTSKSLKSIATCKVCGCGRRVRSKGFCKTHGGGRKCSIESCKKSSQNGDFCIGHGGGKKCKEEGCAKAAQSHSLCKAHGGGARCKFLDCNKSSQGGGLCRAHGGGKRCQASGCPKGAQRGNFCATHGGYRNCKIENCVRTDRGGGFCEVHRRGRLCKVEGCKKLSRNQGMCTVHIREDKQLLVNSIEPRRAEPATALVG